MGNSEGGQVWNHRKDRIRVLVGEEGLWHPSLWTLTCKLGQDQTALEWWVLGRFDSRDKTMYYPPARPRGGEEKDGIGVGGAKAAPGQGLLTLRG